MAGWDLLRFLSVMRLSHTGGWCPRGVSSLPPSWRVRLGRKGCLCCNFPSWLSISTSKTLCQAIFFPERRHEEDTKDNQRDAEAYFTSAIRWHLHCNGLEILWNNHLYCCSILHLRHVFSKYCNDHRFFTQGHLSVDLMTWLGIVTRPDSMCYQTISQTFVKFASCMTKKKKWWGHVKLIFLNLFIESN